MIPQRALLVVAALALGLAPSCQYRLAGSGPGLLPEHVKSIAIVPFENRTTRPEIEQRITEELANEFTRRGRYKVMTNPDQADAVLGGAVLSYRTVPVQFTDSGRARVNESTVRLQAVLRDSKSDELLWSQSGLVFRGQYDVPESEELFFDEESLAMDQIARGAAGAVVTSIVEGF